jgi:hypothetical protein
VATDRADHRVVIVEMYRNGPETDGIKLKHEDVVMLNRIPQSRREEKLRVLGG